MNEDIRTHYLSAGAYTCAGAYEQALRALPDDVPSLGRILCSQIVHPVTLLLNEPEYLELYGDFRRIGDYRLRDESEMFPTAPAMLAELWRLDPRGLTEDRAVENKLYVTCRHMAILVCAALKAKGIPCRARAGFFGYWPNAGDAGDHWVNEYYDGSRWMLIDADGFYPFERLLGFSQYDIPRDRFKFAPDVWLALRRGIAPHPPEFYRYCDAVGTNGPAAAAHQLFADFHALMNDELFYTFQPYYAYENFGGLAPDDLASLDRLAELMLAPDENFAELRGIWESDRRLRLLCTPGNLDLTALGLYKGEYRPVK